MTEKYESDEEKIDWMKTFVLDEDYQSAYEILMKIDEIVRVYSAADGQPNKFSAIEKRIDAFCRDVGHLVLRAVHKNLYASTTKEGSKWKGRAGVFPKHEGEPGFSHLLFGLKVFDPLLTKKFYPLSKPKDEIINDENE
jgi:hypothetical protein